MLRGRDRLTTFIRPAFLTEVVKRNPSSFRIFSPDELGSNKLDAVFDVTCVAGQYFCVACTTYPVVLDTASSNGILRLRIKVDVLSRCYLSTVCTRCFYFAVLSG